LKTEKKSTKIGTLYLVTSAVIAALYVVLTLPFAQFAFGPIQFRLAEMMVVLPILTPAAIPGLTIGCFLTNLLNPNNLGPIDIIFGSLATFLAAVCTRFISQKWTRLPRLPRDFAALIPPVLVNALIVGTYLSYLLTNGAVTNSIIGWNMIYIGMSEAVVVYVLGLPFLLVLRKTGIGGIWMKKMPQHEDAESRN
jgi:uncharacterized membrane protein